MFGKYNRMGIVLRKLRKLAMTRITADQSLRSRLNGLTDQVEFCDESGATLGHFIPAEWYRRLLHAYAERQCPYSREELDRFEDETGGKTLEEIWESLDRE
jgi:hypothetical protein